MECNKCSEVKTSGLCKHCHKFFCDKCAIDTGWGFVCSDSCATQLAVVRKIVSLNEQAIRETESIKMTHFKDLKKNIKYHLGLLSFWIVGLAISIVKAAQYGDSDYSMTFGFIFGVLTIASLVKIKMLNQAIKESSG
jgi:hypothetical protein